jgi:hypothetical protein
MVSTPSQDALSQEKNDDLDLLVIVKIAVDFLKKNGKKLLLTSIAGMFCGVILNFSFPKHYTSRLLMESAVLSNTEVRAVIEDWSSLLSERGRPYLMKDFNCDEKTVRNILALLAEPMNAQNEAQPGFILTVSIRDTANLQGVQSALQYGFSHNDYIRRRVDQHRQAMIDQIKETDAQIKKLDSTGNFIEGAVESVQKEKTPLILDISNLPNTKVNLVERKSQLEEKLEFVDGVLLIQGFTRVTGPMPGLFSFLAIGLAGGFLIGYFLILLSTLNRNLSKLSSN